MALDFPANPVDGQEYNGYIWDDVEGYWKRNPLPPVINATDINDIDTTGAEDGNALVYDATAGQWVPGVAAPSGVKENTSDNINIDFADNIPLETRAVTGDVTFTASNYTAGAHKTVYLTGDTVSRNLTFPATWNFITDKPTIIGADKKNMLDLNSFGTSESTTVALWLGQTSFEPISATGGTITQISVDGVTYQVHRFSSTGTFSVTSIGNDANVEYLVVGGGGGGSNDHGGGGGAGGFLTGTTTASVFDHPATVGLGGTGGLAVRNSPSGLGTQGGDSSIFGITAFGGGYGGALDSGLPSSGGSGGGGSPNGSGQPGGLGTAGQGNAGGQGSSADPSYQSGGGGGAGTTGFPGTETTARPDGGAGLPSSITGTAIYYAGGGGGCSAYDRADYGIGGDGGGGRGATNTSPAVSGTDGLGGGGGGGNRYAAAVNHAASSIGPAGDGGNGIIIVRYPITDPN